MVILAFFVLHWQLSVFLQSFYLHRYGAHGQFTMKRGWERFFHFVTFLVQGSSYLNPRAYAILHRMHHAYSDTPKDPHSPNNYGNVFSMMWATAKTYAAIVQRTREPEPRFEGGYPSWPALDSIADAWVVRFGFMALYTLFYVAFAPHWACFLLLPFHFLMGPMHGAIVNWCGHRYGYRNFDIKDGSRNTLVFDVLTMGELFQNNHHKFGMSPNFAVRVFEVDPGYQAIRLLSLLRIVDMSGAQRARWIPSEAAPEPAPGE